MESHRGTVQQKPDKYYELPDCHSQPGQQTTATVDLCNVQGSETVRLAGDWRRLNSFMFLHPIYSFMALNKQKM